MLRDITFEHINRSSESEYIFVTFASWSVNDPVFFGKSFFEKGNVEAFVIAQTKVNHWYHTEEISKVAKIVKSKAEESNKDIILYGSSMGGYAAIHYRNMFNAAVCIAIAPQIFINKNISYYENRWSKDLALLQDKMYFDEVNNLLVQNGKAFILYDPLHSLDNQHIESYRELIDKEADFIKVPYSSHDLARFLHNAGMLKEIIYQISEKRVISNNLIVELNTLFLEDHKTFFNYFRNKSAINNHIDKNLIQKMSKYLENIEIMDFEALYMAAETLSNLGRHEEAVSLSTKSIESYKARFTKDAPTYLYSKHDLILKNSKE